MSDPARWGKATSAKQTTLRGEYRPFPKDMAIDLTIEGRDTGFGRRYRFKVFAAGGLSAQSLYIYHDEEAAKRDAIHMAQSIHAIRK